MERGYVKLWRKVEDSGLFGHPVAWTLFSYLLVKATRFERKMPTQWGAITLQPGQWATGRRKIARDLNSGEQSIRTAIKILTSMGNITHTSTKELTVFTIVNWDTYQASNQQPTHTQPTPNPPLTTKQDSEIVELKKEPITISKPRVPRAAKKKELDLTGFDEWYRIYPKKNNRARAEDEWSLLTPEVRALCLEAIKWQSKSKDHFVGREWKYMKDPGNWIKDRRWTDEPESGRGSGTGDGGSTTKYTLDDGML